MEPFKKAIIQDDPVQQIGQSNEDIENTQSSILYDNSQHDIMNKSRTVFCPKDRRSSSLPILKGKSRLEVASLSQIE